MEKLVRRHFRKEPGHLACRVGPVVFAALLSLFALSAVEAQTHGHPAKVVRMPEANTFDVRVAFEPESAPASAPSMTEEAPSPVETVTNSEPEPVLVVEAERPPARTRPRKIVLTKGPYLPVIGPQPLRFSATRSWPSPLPEPEVNEEPAVAAVAATTESTPDESPPSAAESVMVAASQSVPPKPAAYDTTMPNVLTADMVLGFLGDLPASSTRVQGRFEPAVPQGAGSSTGSISP